jgi:hypothetical protein
MSFERGYAAPAWDLFPPEIERAIVVEAGKRKPPIHVHAERADMRKADEMNGAMAGSAAQSLRYPGRVAIATVCLSGATHEAPQTAWSAPKNPSRLGIG